MSTPLTLVNESTWLFSGEISNSVILEPNNVLVIDGNISVKGSFTLQDSVLSITASMQKPEKDENGKFYAIVLTES